MTVFPKSYVDPKTKRLHPKFWINQNGRWKRRFHEAVEQFGVAEFCRAATPHVIDIGNAFGDDADRTWDDMEAWMTENASAPWYFWLRRAGDRYIAFADVSDAVHFALWMQPVTVEPPAPKKEVDRNWRVVDTSVPCK